MIDREKVSAIEASTIRMIVCDDHALMRDGLRRVLSDDPAIEIVAEAGTAAEAVDACRAHQSDIVLLDITLPGGSGISAIKQILEVSPATRILMLTMHEDVAYLREAFSEGAMGYVLKAAADTEVLQAVHEVAAGRRYVHPTLGAALLQHEDRVAEEPTGVAVGLTEREKEILRFLSLGYTNAEMAEMLCLSVRTIETYRWRLQQKVGLRTRAELARLARESGLVK